MKSVLLSIRLYYFYLTYKGLKTEEIRKKFPLNFKGKIYEYVSKTNWKQDLMKIPGKEREFFKQFVGKVGLCFYCDKVEDIDCTGFYEDLSFDKGREIESYNTDALTEEELLDKTCLTEEELFDYIGGGSGYAIHISQLEIFDRPKELWEFDKCVLTEDLSHDNIIFIHQRYKITKAPQNFCYVEVEE